MHISFYSALCAGLSFMFLGLACCHAALFVQPMVQ